MKKILAILSAILLLILPSCNNQSPKSDNPTDTSPLTGITEISTQKEKNEESTEPQESTPEDIEKNKINSMEKLTDIEEVISVTKQSFSTQTNYALAYKVLYETQNGKLSADVVLPKDYTLSNKNYPVLIYFPQLNISIDELASKYALNGIIAIRPYARGYGDSEGMRDLGGEKDLFDAKKLLEIFDSANFIKNSKIFVAGSSEGSITAMRLFAEDSSKRISGCAVVDVISDLPAFGEFRGDGIKNLLTSLIGKSYEEATEEYDLRSAVKFSQKLDRPILILHYLQNPLVSIEQPDALYNLIKDANPDCAYYKIDELSADFQGESSQRLLSFISKYD